MMNNGEFVGARLELARAFQQVTLKELADRIGISTAALGHYEKGIRRPGEDTIAALAFALKVKPAFFLNPLEDIWQEHECSFRRRVATPEGVKKRARAHGTLLSLVIRELAAVGVKIPKLNFPTAAPDSTEDIERSAELCREHWRLGQGPIEHIGRVAERNGAILVRHLAYADQIDAFARKGDPSLIILNVTRRSTSRWIFDVAHEMGHLVLHDAAQTGSKETEDQAHRFASALLLPRRAFAREFRSRPFSWGHVFDLKRRWYTSATALIRRAYELLLLDPIAYNRCYQHMSVQGWLKNEPYEPAFVGPEWLGSAFALAEQKFRVGASALCDRLCLTSETFTAVTGMSPETTAPIRFRPRAIAG
jgi:Zn-dependent peptidase ImmA (M78 family)/DNA-binding XRE family transcriptional regulator